MSSLEISPRPSIAPARLIGPLRRAEIVRESYAPETTVADVARRNGVDKETILQWRRELEAPSCARREPKPAPPRTKRRASTLADGLTLDRLVSIILETRERGATVASVARRHGLKPQKLYYWVIRYREEADLAAAARLKEASQRKAPVESKPADKVVSPPVDSTSTKATDADEMSPKPAAPEASSTATTPKTEGGGSTGSAASAPISAEQFNELLRIIGALTVENMRLKEQARLAQTGR